MWYIYRTEHCCLVAKLWLTLQLQKEQRCWAKGETMPSWGCVWWWKASLMLARTVLYRTCRVTSTKQGKWKWSKRRWQERTISILAITELKWTGMSEFNSHDHIYDCRQESLRRNGLVLVVNNRVRNAVLGCKLKNDRMISVHFQGKSFNIT